MPAQHRQVRAHDETARPSGRMSRVIAQIAAVLALIAVAASVHVFRPTWLSSAYNYAFHPPVFAVLAAGLIVILRRTQPARRAYASALGLALVAGFGGEGLQVIGPGDPSWGDLGRDLIGIFGVLALFAAWDRPLWENQSRWRRGACATAGFGLLLATLIPLLWVGYVLIQRSLAFPVLATFDGYWERGIFADGHDTAPVPVPVPENWPLPGGKAAIVPLDHPRYPGLNIHDPYPDWSGYESLTFIAASTTGEAIRFRLRIHDRAHDHRRSSDRFVREFVADPVPGRYTIGLSEVAGAPEGRVLDLSAIDGIILYSRERNPGDRVMVDDFRLQ